MYNLSLSYPLEAIFYNYTIYGASLEINIKPQSPPIGSLSVKKTGIIAKFSVREGYHLTMINLFCLRYIFFYVCPEMNSCNQC